MYAILSSLHSLPDLTAITLLFALTIFYIDLTTLYLLYNITKPIKLPPNLARQSSKKIGLAYLHIALLYVFKLWAVFLVLQFQGALVFAVRVADDEVRKRLEARVAMIEMWG